MIALESLDGHTELALAVLDDVAFIQYAVQERYPPQGFNVCPNNLVGRDDDVVLAKLPA